MPKGNYSLLHVLGGLKVPTSRTAYLDIILEDV